MNPEQYLARYQGQSLLYSPSPAREYLRGQCVQPVCFYVEANGFPVMWRDAADWWHSGLFADRYERIPNSPTARPEPGDIIIWAGSLPNSGNAGHIAVCLRALAGTGTFISVDSNWGGKYVHAVTHDYAHVIGWLRMKRPAPAPAPAPQPTSQGDSDMAITRDDVIREYRVNRGTDPSEAEIGAQLNGGNMKSLSFGFAVENQQRREGTARQLGEMQTQINAQNDAISSFQLKLNDTTLSNDKKQKALDEMLAMTAQTNAALTAAHDRIVELEQQQPTPSPTPSATSTWLINLLAILTKWKTKTPQ